MNLACTRVAVACLVASAFLTAQSHKGPPPEASSGGHPTVDNELRHIEGASSVPMSLDFGARGPLGSMIRSRTVNGQFAIPVQIVESFESGTLGPAWTTLSSDSGGRIRILGDYGGADGDLALFMDRNPSGIDTLNEAILTIDMTSMPNAAFVFSEWDQNDEETAFSGDFTGSYNADGVAISDDGVRWHPVWTPEAGGPGWEQHRIDLAAEAAAAGMTLGAGFQIKFQQYDNWPASSDGRGFDGIGFEIPGLDADEFTIEMDPGQHLDVEVTSAASVQAYVRVARDATVIAQGLASGPGEPVQLQAIDTFGTLSGKGIGTQTYTITVVNANGAMGSYSLFVALNETSELEPPGGSTNDDRASAEQLDPAFVPLLTNIRASGNGRLPQRAAVRGQGGQKTARSEGFESGALDGSWTTSSSTATGRIRVTNELGAYSGAYALVMDNDASGTPPTASFYEQFTGPSDLSGQAITLTPNAGGGYDVAASAATYIAPLANMNMYDDQVLSRSLGFSLDWPGYGPTGSIAISSNGRIGPPGQINTAYSESVSAFLASPQLCAMWDDFNPYAGGDVYFDASPGMAVVTWENVPQYYYGGSNTFQIQILDSGVIHVLWPHVESDGIVGFSDGRVTGEEGYIAPVDLTTALPFSTSVSGPGGATYNLNEAIWTIDMTTVVQPRLRFRYRGFGDEYHPFSGPFTGSYDADGVAISGDGVNWTPLTSLSSTSYWYYRYFDLEAVAAAAAISLGPNFQIKFQQYDNTRTPSDGLAFDNIEILANDADHYRVSLVAGESIAFYGTGTGLDLTLTDGNGAPLAAQLRQPIVNGGFQSLSGWTRSWNASPPFYPGIYSYENSVFPSNPLYPVEGYRLYAAPLSSYSSYYVVPPYRYTLSQTIDLPNPVPGPLTWYECVRWNLTGGNPATLPRTHTVELRDPGTGATLQQLSQFTIGTSAATPTGDTGWVMRMADVSGFAGQRVQLVFEQLIPEANTGIADVCLDAVQLAGINQNVDAHVPVFVVPATGDYYLRVGSTGTYDVLALRNAEFGLEPNESVALAQPIQSVVAAGRRWVSGHGGTPTSDPDFFQIQGTGGHTLVAEVYVPASGGGSFDNLFLPQVSVYDAASNVVATAVGSVSDPTHVRLEHEFAETGTYAVAVTAARTDYASEDFESGVLGPQWSTSSSTQEGRIEVSGEYKASGNYGLLMSKYTAGAYNQNDAVWTVDLTGATSPTLSFWHQSIGDENHTGDYVQASANGGASWVDLTLPTDVGYRQVQLGNYFSPSSFGPNFKIRFRQYDNYPVPSDGRAFDDISIYETAPAGEYVLSIKGDG